MAVTACVLGVVSVAAGCGDAGSSGSLDEALGYLPGDAPFVLAVDTDVEGDQVKAIEKIAERFPFSGQVRDSLEQNLSGEGIDFERDVKPVLGNELVVGTADAAGIVGDDAQRFVAAIQAADKGALDKLIEKAKARKVGEKNGATIYSANGDGLAVDDDILVIADSRKELEDALGEKGSDERLTADDFEQSTADLPDDSLIRLALDLEQLLRADPETAAARKVKWVEALRELGLTASFAEDRVTIDFKLATDSEGLSEGDLPLAVGSESPSVLEAPGEVGVGIRDPEQILRFAEGAGEAVDPSAFGEYSAGKRTIESQLGVSIEDDLLGQLRDDLSLSIAVDGSFGARARVKDPDAFDATLRKLGRVLPRVAEGAVGEPIGFARPGRGEDFYALSTAEGQSVVYGLVDGVFVLANDSDRAGELANEAARPVEGAEGAVAFQADAQQLVAQALRRSGSTSGLEGAIGGGILADPLGELTGSLAAEPDGLRGKLTLAFD